MAVKRHQNEERCPTPLRLRGWDVWTAEPAAVVPFLDSPRFWAQFEACAITRLDSGLQVDDRLAEERSVGEMLQHELPETRYSWAARWWPGMSAIALSVAIAFFLLGPGLLLVAGLLALVVAVFVARRRSRKARRRRHR
jgi:hypothetical protein